MSEQMPADTVPSPSEKRGTVLGALLVCGGIGIPYGLAAGEISLVVGSVAMVVLNRGEWSLALIMPFIGFAYVMLWTLPSGFLAGIIYGAFGNRAGAILAGLAGAATTPLGASVCLSLLRRHGMPADGFAVLYGTATLIVGPLFALWAHSKVRLRNRGSLAGAIAATLSDSSISRWPGWRRAILGIFVTVVGMTAVDWLWIRIDWLGPLG